jgi:hypothetical protein
VFQGKERIGYDVPGIQHIIGRSVLMQNRRYERDHPVIAGGVT